jgi:hypothetical protein
MTYEQKQRLITAIYQFEAKRCLKLMSEQNQTNTRMLTIRALIHTATSDYGRWLSYWYRKQMPKYRLIQAE